MYIFAGTPPPEVFVPCAIFFSGVKINDLGYKRKVPLFLKKIFSFILKFQVIYEFHFFFFSTKLYRCFFYLKIQALFWHIVLKCVEHIRIGVDSLIQFSPNTFGIDLFETMRSSSPGVSVPGVGTDDCSSW